MCLSQLPPKEYFRHYRKLLGFANQGDAKAYLGAKDISPTIDYDYIDSLLERLADIVRRLDGAVVGAPKPSDIDAFIEATIRKPYEQIRKNNLIPRLNNQGRRPEGVLFSWLRGHATAEFFLPALQEIFGATGFICIGEDDFSSTETFKRAPTADYQISRPAGGFRIEIQSGFQSISDIKQHKVLEAKRIFRVSQVPTLCVHIDVFNGQCAFVRLDDVEEGDINWISRQQMEGQTVLNINQNAFGWRIADRLPTLDDLEIEL